MTSLDDITTSARRLYQALDTGDTALLDGALAPDWEAIPANPHTSPGAAGYRELVGFLRTTLEGLTVSIEDVVAAGDRVVVRTVARGTHAGELLGIPATGREVSFAACDIHRIQDGRVAQTWHLEDYFGLLTQLGATFSVTPERG